MHLNDALFAAWSDAERLARDAERQLYELILNQAGEPPARLEVERVRTLRDRASEVLAEMLQGMRSEALSLRDPVQGDFTASRQW